MRILTLALLIFLTGCAPVSAIAAQRAMVRVLKIGGKRMLVTNLTDHEHRQLVAKVNVKPTINVNPPAHPAHVEAEQFRDALNAYRRRHLLGPVQLDAQLTADAKTNNDRGGYHRYMGHASRQNWASPPSMMQSLEMWKNSAGHNANLLARDVTLIGIASDPRAGCTLNLR